MKQFLYNYHQIFLKEDISQHIFHFVRTVIINGTIVRIEQKHKENEKIRKLASEGQVIMD